MHRSSIFCLLDTHTQTHIYNGLKPQKHHEILLFIGNLVLSEIMKPRRNSTNKSAARLKNSGDNELITTDSDVVSIPKSKNREYKNFLHVISHGKKHLTHPNCEKIVRRKPYNMYASRKPLSMCAPRNPFNMYASRKPFSMCAPRNRSNRDVPRKSDEKYVPRKAVRKHVPRANSNPKLTRGKESADHAENIQPVIRPFDICTCYDSECLMGEPMLPARNMGKHINIEYPITETRQIRRPGMVLLTNYISFREQVNIINKCRELGLGPGGFYQPGYQNGGKLRLRMLCLGKRWDPVTKYEEHSKSDDQQTLSIPDEFLLLVKKALSDAHLQIKKNELVNNVEEMLPGISPDICIVNFYTSNGKLGLHQDRDESKDSLCRGLPVVSLSVGDSAEFLYGDTRDVSKAESVFLQSGDVLIFGGESRHIYHGVTSIIPNSAPQGLLKETNLRPGRLNLTFRQF